MVRKRAGSLSGAKRTMIYVHAECTRAVCWRAESVCAWWRVRASGDGRAGCEGAR